MNIILLLYLNLNDLNYPASPKTITFKRNFLDCDILLFKLIIIYLIKFVIFSIL